MICLLRKKKTSHEIPFFFKCYCYFFSIKNNCNKQGFNVYWSSTGSPHARLGITANQENDCLTCDSVIGFGTGHGHHKSTTCGNYCRIHCDEGDRIKTTFGYILVQWYHFNLLTIGFKL